MDTATGAPNGWGKTSHKRPIRLTWIVSGVAALLTAGVVGVVGGTAERDTRTALTSEIRTRVVFEARNLALASSGALLSDFPELTLTPILSELRKGQDELAFATVVDREGTILGHPDARRIGQHYELPSGLGAIAEIAGLAPDEEVLMNGDVLVVSVPVRHPGSGDPIGSAYVAIEMAYVDAALKETRRDQLIVFAGLLAAGVALVAFLMSVLLRPLGELRAGLERIGRGDLDSPVHLNDRTELGFLAETMNEMAARIRVAQDERLEKDRLAHEVDLAREIQASLLPAGDLRTNGVVVTGAHRAAAEVGGDYWDVFELDDGQIGIAIADVSGKGLAGCLVTSMLSALLGSFRKTETSPKSLLLRLERDLRDSLRPGTFITMFYGILDPGSGRFVFASAGHSPLLVRRAGGATEWYRTKGIPIGALRGNHLERSLRDEVIDLRRGDLAIQYTDGINEAFAPGGEEQFGFERLEKAVAGTEASDAAGMLDLVRRAVEEWVGDQPPLDDETLLVVGRDEAPVSAPNDPAIADPSTVAGDPLAILARARRVGYHIRLPAREDALGGLLNRIPHCPELSALSSGQIHVLESALYEACANIAEHGLEQRADETFDLWWVPFRADEGRDGDPPAEPDGRGTFVLLDRGIPFVPKSNHPIDFDDPEVRRKGRGLGLEIIRAAMRRIEYHPATAEGNVTLLRFDPSCSRDAEGVTHER